MTMNAITFAASSAVAVGTLLALLWKWIHKLSLYILFVCISFIRNIA
jgi:hypothetical protein